jgi:hypothetical protein
VPLLHFSLPLDEPDAARAFLEHHGAKVACYRLDPRGEGKLMIGLFSGADAKKLAREELNMEVPTTGLFGQYG